MQIRGWGLFLKDVVERIEEPAALTPTEAVAKQALQDLVQSCRLPGNSPRPSFASAVGILGPHCQALDIPVP